MSNYLSSTDIATICNVHKSTVSNWKKRYNDFPLPVIENRETKLYDKADILEFLKRRGKIK